MRTFRSRRLTAMLLAFGMLTISCGQTVLVREIETSGGVGVGATAGSARGDSSTQPSAQRGGGTDKQVRASGPKAEAAQGPSRSNAVPRDPDKRCATSATDTGVTKNSLTWGTILPLSGPTRPLGEQTARVLKRSVNYYNQLDHDPSRPDLNWGCAERKGIYGRKVNLEIASISSDSEDDALQAMRRLVDVEKAFLVRDCYLQSSLMGPAHGYAERNDVTTTWCYPESLPQPELAPHTWSLGTDRQTQASLLVGYQMRELGAERIAMLYDPTYEEQAEAVRSVVGELGGEIVKEVQARAQTAVNGRRSEVMSMRSANPDAVIILDALNATYAGVAAGQLGWRPKDSGVSWACSNCWLKFAADVGGENLATMITNTSGLPFRPTNEGARRLWQIKNSIMPGEPNDVLTFAGLVTTAALFVYTAEAGPDLTREKLEDVFLSLENYSSGFTPPITTSESNHFGGRQDWLVEFNGNQWPNSFSDTSGGYIGLDQVGVRPEWTDPS
ncbi:MAG: ABC transporter substrate-binding protein [Actinophytocola sp.]|nr:ABC transporter substrate-binding protein [Actinophytocola sp.]